MTQVLRHNLFATFFQTISRKAVYLKPLIYKKEASTSSKATELLITLIPLTELQQERVRNLFFRVKFHEDFQAFLKSICCPLSAREEAKGSIQLFCIPQTQMHVVLKSSQFKQQCVNRQYQRLHIHLGLEISPFFANASQFMLRL